MRGRSLVVTAVGALVALAPVAAHATDTLRVEVAAASAPATEPGPPVDTGDTQVGTAVIGGATAARGTWPEVVALLAPTGSPAQAQFCGGTLIDPWWVLTAAHCVTGQSYPATEIRVLLGNQDLASGGGELRGVAQVVVHPGYPQSGVATIGSGHDLALVQLRAPSAQTTMPLFEPVPHDWWGTPGADDCVPGRCGLVAGWGLTSQSPNQFPDQLQEAQVGIYTEAECESSTDGLFRSDLHTELCVGYQGVNVCRGDSGGPLLADDGTGRLRVAGVVSYGWDDCIFTVSVFTRVDAFADWIAGVISQPPPVASAGTGYWMVSSTGTVYAFGAVPDQLDAQPAAAVTDIEATPSGLGYWVVDESGTVWAQGDATFLGSAPDRRPGELWTSITATPDGTGYWVFSDRGRVATFGSAVHFGDLSDVSLNGPVLDAVATPTGDGYYLVGSDGGVFAFGDAAFHGSMGGTPLNQPVRALVPDPDGTGYWLVASDGGVFAFEAGFGGSMGGVALSQPVVGMVAYGDGYLMVGADGGIFNFSSLPFAGSLGATAIPDAIVAVTAH